MAIPERPGKFLDWLKLPNPLTGAKGEIEVGDKVTIKSEFVAPESPKIKNPLIAEVELANGEMKQIGINWSTYTELSKKFASPDTSEWIGSIITYKGMKQFTKGTGHFWTVE